MTTWNVRTKHGAELNITAEHARESVRNALFDGLTVVWWRTGETNAHAHIGTSPAAFPVTLEEGLYFLQHLP